MMAQPSNSAAPKQEGDDKPSAVGGTGLVLPGLLRFMEALPVVGFINAFFYWILGCGKGEPERAAAWSALGLIPIFNIWRLFVVVYRHIIPNCHRRKLQKKIEVGNSGAFHKNVSRPAPGDCRNCRENDSLRFVQRSPIAPNLVPCSWMADKSVRQRSLLKLCIPGSHDSTAYKNQYASGLKSVWSVCQQKSIFRQLEMGIRYLDVRVRDATDERHLKNDSIACWHSHPKHTDRYWCAHTFLTIPLTEVLKDVARFLITYPTEIVIMGLRTDCVKFSDDAWRTLSALFESRFTGKLIERGEVNESVGRLVDAGKQLLILATGCPMADSSRMASVETQKDCSAGDEYVTLDIDDTVATKDEVNLKYFVDVDFNDLSAPKLLTGSYSETESTCGTQLQRSLLNWLRDKQDAMYTNFHVAQCEITPSAKNIAAAYLYHSLSDDIYFSVKDCAYAANRVLRWMLQEPDCLSLHLNIVTHDFVAADIVADLIARNSVSR